MLSYSFDVSHLYAESLFVVSRVELRSSFAISRVGLSSSSATHLLKAESSLAVSSEGWVVCSPSAIWTLRRRLPSTVWRRNRLFAIKPCRRWVVVRHRQPTQCREWRVRPSSNENWGPLLPDSCCSRGQSLPRNEPVHLSWGTVVNRQLFPAWCYGQSLSWDESVHLVTRPSCTPLRDKNNFSI